MKKVTVYSTDPCARCVNAKALLKARGVEYEEVNLSKDAVGRAELAQRTGLLTFPQILVDDELIGGWDDLRAAVGGGRLNELLDSAGR